ncbi:MAG TPA: tRNA pseudouridine(55) synthase TruB [Streptosporangiaceae bacterium]|nr:tRNA pseudouridine(55) synthase TruB [Streptosporangiaceae bacterium]
MTAVSGLVIVDKPAGLTSHDVVARIRRLAGTRRVGHAGTLDPMATGVLVVGVEKATRLLGHLALADKEYSATIRLGQSTNTDDAEGEVTGGAPASGVSGELLSSAVAALTGSLMQVPPAISAVKVNGERAYKMTRAGTAPDLAARPVTVQEFTITAVRRITGTRAAAAPAAPGTSSTPGTAAPTAGAPGAAAGQPCAAAGQPGATAGQPGAAGDVLDVDADIRCSSGTYIRALARDLGAALGTGGHLTRLRRTRTGAYDISQARTLDQLAERFAVTPLEAAAAAAFPRRDVTGEQARRVSHGGTLPAAGFGPEPAAVFGPDGTFIALVREEGGRARPVAVFAG